MAEKTPYVGSKISLVMNKLAESRIFSWASKFKRE